jgi:hypothetical protein
MSRSNPTAGLNPNPAERFYEWRGSTGNFAYYDKEKKIKVDVPLPFTFLMLDHLSTIKGFNKQHGGIYSNEIRDTRNEPFVVKFFKGGTIAEGFYGAIKDKIVAQDGHFVDNVYIAFQEAGQFKIGAIQMQGCALGPWFEFHKLNKKDLDNKAVTVNTTELDKTGRVEFHKPVFTLKEIRPETHAAALDLDKKLQVYLEGYFKRSRLDQATAPKPEAAPDPENDGYEAPAPTAASPKPKPEPKPLPVESDDVPF